MNETLSPSPPTTGEQPPATSLGRRPLLATMAAVSAMAAASAQAQERSDAARTVALERLPGGVLLIGINRAEARNLIDVPTFYALGQAFHAFEHDDQLRVAVLHGKGPDFSQGLDLASWGRGLRAGPLKPPTDFLDPFGTSGAERSKPLVVAVQGHVRRIAHELFLAADVRVAAEDAIFNQGEVTAASFPGGGASVRFVREAGWANAMRYMLTGESWGVAEASAMGLVQEVTPVGRQLDRAMDFAKAIAVAAPMGVRALMVSARRAVNEGERAAMAALQPEFGRLLSSEDRQEFLRSLQDKRAPVYQGR
jgi:enoyl-CoA hydratase/carnithine racemase